MTDALAGYLSVKLLYSNKTLSVIDNGSPEPPRMTTHRLEENVGFTRGMYWAWRQLRHEGADAFWFLNSDVNFRYGDDVLCKLVRVLFSSESYAQIAPQHNSPHHFMQYAFSEAQVVPYLEPTATLVKRSTIERIGFWDVALTMGWGVDYDYGFRIREAGLTSVLTNTARIVHNEHGSMCDPHGYANAAASEMDYVLSQRYGSNWHRTVRQ